MFHYVPFIRKRCKYILEEHSLQYEKKPRDIRDKEQLMIDIDTLSLSYLRTPIKTWGKLRCNGRVYSYCYISGIRYVTLVINPVKNPELGQVRIALPHLWSVIIKKKQIYICRKSRLYTKECNSGPLIQVRL